MTTSISERATAYRTALRLALNDGHSIKAATDAAKAAARNVSNLPEPPKAPVILTDAELRLIDENELTADECDRLTELEQAETNAQERAFEDSLPKGIAKLERDRDAFNEDEATKEGDYCSNCGIPHQIHGDECGQEDFGPGVLAGVYNRAAQASLHGSITAVNKSSVVRELAEALGYRVVEVPLVPSDEELDIMQAVREHEVNEAKAGMFLVPNENIAEELFRRRMAKLEGNCEPEDYMTDQLGQHGDEPKDLGDFGAGTLADAWRDGVGIETPALLKLTGRAHFMAGLGIELDEAAEFAQAQRDAIASLEGYDDDPDRDPETGAYNLCVDKQMNALLAEPRCVSGFPGPGVLADLAANRKPRDCDIPATLRAIELPATEDHNSYRLWFDGDDEMQQFLAGRCLYADADRSVKDRDGKVVGMWFYAHFGPTPVS